MLSVARFVDVKGEGWPLVISVAHVEDVEAATGVNLEAAVLDIEVLTRDVFGSPRKFAAVLWHLVRAEAEGRGLDARGFKERLDGPTIERATEAMLEAVVDFSHRSKAAAAIKGRLREGLDRVDETALRRIESLSWPSATASPGPPGE